MKRNVAALLLGLTLSAGLAVGAPDVARADASSERCANLALNMYFHHWRGDFDAYAQLHAEFLAAGCDPTLDPSPQQ